MHGQLSYLNVSSPAAVGEGLLPMLWDFAFTKHPCLGSLEDVTK